MSMLGMGGGAGSLEAGGEEPGSGQRKSTPTPTLPGPMFLLFISPQPCLNPRPQSVSPVRKTESASGRVDRAGDPRPCSCWDPGKGWLGSWQLGRENMVSSAVSAATAA